MKAMLTQIQLYYRFPQFLQAPQPPQTNDRIRRGETQEKKKAYWVCTVAEHFWYICLLVRAIAGHRHPLYI